MKGTEGSVRILVPRLRLVGCEVNSPGVGGEAERRHLVGGCECQTRADHRVRRGQRSSALVHSRVDPQTDFCSGGSESRKKKQRDGLFYLIFLFL